MSAVGYIRTELLQKNVPDFDVQKGAIIKYATFNDLEIKKIYCDDDIVGNNIEKMLQELTPETSVICYNLSVLSDSISGLNKIYKKINDINSNMIIIENQIDTRKNNGKIMLFLLDEFSRIETNNVNKKIKDYKNSLQRKGVIKKKPPYGYKHDKNGGITEDEDEMRVVNKIKMMIKSNNQITVSEIIRNLKNDNEKIRKSKDIYHTSIQNIIQQYEMR